MIQKVGKILLDTSFRLLSDYKNVKFEQRNGYGKSRNGFGKFTGKIFAKSVGTLEHCPVINCDHMVKLGLESKEFLRGW